MKHTINDKGRTCSCCKEFKCWSEYGLHKKGTRGRKSRCKSCRNDIAYVSRTTDPRPSNCTKSRWSLTPDELMDRLNQIAYKKRLKFYRDFFNSSIKRCNTCGILKYVNLFDSFTHKGTNKVVTGRVCHSCKSESKERERLQSASAQKSRRLNRIKEALVKVDTDDKHTGFIYLFYSDELDCLKIGKTISNPFDYIKVKSWSYGLDLNLVCFISVNFKLSDAEYLASRDFDRIDYRKPCGTSALELFNGSLSDGISALYNLSKRIYIENSYAHLLGSCEIKPMDIDFNEISLKKKYKYKYLKSERCSKRVARGILNRLKNKRMWAVNGFPCHCRSELKKPKRFLSVGGDCFYFMINYTKIKLPLIKSMDVKQAVEYYKDVFDLRDSYFICGKYRGDVKSALIKMCSKLNKNP